VLNPHARLPLSPLAMWRSVWLNRRLIARLARRDIVARYRGSLGGLLWTVATPGILRAGLFCAYEAVPLHYRFHEL